MIITKISDGFGNQLFMYACGYALSKQLRTKLMLDVSYLDTNSLRSYELNKLSIRYDKLFSVQIFRYYLLKVFFRKLVHACMKFFYKPFYERQIFKYDTSILNVKETTYLFGYWQSEKYFKHFRNDLLKMFTPKYELSEECKSYINQVQACNSVAIHVRRGDYVALGICLSRKYYEEAIDLINRRVKEPIFYVFSDDLEFAKQMFEEKQGLFNFVKYRSTNPSLDDFFIMKECNHIIMANSTYSWWAAWLNNNSDKIVVCPKPKQGKDDFYPDEWVKLS